MNATKICFQCPRCNSFNTSVKTIRTTPMESHEGFHFINTDLVCNDCKNHFSKKLTAITPEEFTYEVTDYMQGGCTPSCFDLSLNSVCHIEKS